jgi:hypothetical protein
VIFRGKPSKVCSRHKTRLEPGAACPLCLAEPETRLERVRNEVGAVLLDANDRIERLIERLRSQEPNQRES